MKSKKTIITALILIAAAILMILNGVGVAFGSGIELWRIALGAALLAWLVWVISDKKYHEVFLPPLMQNSSLFSLPSRRVDAKPAPNSIPFTAGMPNTTADILLSMPPNSAPPSPA